MATTLFDLMHPQVILDVVSRVKRGRGGLGDFFGFHALAFPKGATGPIKGKNTTESPTRSGTYRIFDNTRTAANAMTPGTGPSLYQPQPIGEVAYTCMRLHEKIRLLGEELGHLSTTLGPNSVIDSNGQDYISRQTQFLAERINNAVELTTWGMIRGVLYLKNVGDKWIPTLTQPSAPTPYVSLDFRVPAGNKSQLDMLGAGNIIGTSWANSAAPVVTDLMQINEAFVNLTGSPLSHVWIDGPGWINVITNTQVINTSGSSNTPMASFDQRPGVDADGDKMSLFTASIRGLPWITWHICDDVMVADGGTDPTYSAGTGTLTKAIPTNNALFTVEPDKRIADYLYCGELISEQPGQPMVKRTGYHFWSEWVTQPSCIELISLFNGVPRLSIPKSIAYGTVVF